MRELASFCLAILFGFLIFTNIAHPDLYINNISLDEIIEIEDGYISETYHKGEPVTYFIRNKSYDYYDEHYSCNIELRWNYPRDMYQSMDLKCR